MKGKLTIAQNYKGSAKEYIKQVLLPQMPNVDLMISSAESLYEYLKNPEALRIIRKTKGFNLRGNVYPLGGQFFTVADNEPALWFYMESLVSPGPIDFQEAIQNERFPIAFAIKKEERPGLVYKTYGKKSRENSFSDLGWKHCHILPCSPRDGVAELSLESRMIRLLNPMNHFPFPAPRRFSMPSDYGEDSGFIALVIQTLLEEVYVTENQRKAFYKFVELAGMPSHELKKVLLVGDFEISIGTKEDTKETAPERVPRGPATTPDKGQRPTGVHGTPTSGTLQVAKNFIIKKAWDGEGYTVRIPRLGVEFDHDALVKGAQHVLQTSAKNSWDKYGCYTNTKSWPGWADDFIRPISDK